MIIQYLQHVPFEGLGNIENWARQNSHEIRAVRLFAGDMLPPFQETDLLIILGGPMNVSDEAKFPFLTHEKRFIERAIKEEKRVLGICLGAQLLAGVMGAKVYRNEHEEIGWFPVKPANNVVASASPFADGFTKSFTTFHWHGATFSLPAGATHLLESAGCRNQAFSFGGRILGVQFHPEVTAESVRLMIENEAGELGAGKYVQTAEEILSPERPFAENAVVLNKFLEKLVPDRA